MEEIIIGAVMFVLGIVTLFFARDHFKKHKYDITGIRKKKQKLKDVKEEQEKIIREADPDKKEEIFNDFLDKFRGGKS